MPEHSPSAQARWETLNKSLTNIQIRDDEVGRDQIQTIEKMRDVAKQFGKLLVDGFPEGRELSLALTKLEESVMWAIKSIIMKRDI